MSEYTVYNYPNDLPCIILYIWRSQKSLNDKGDIIISTPYHGYLKNLTLSLLNKWDSHMSPLWHRGHIKLWSKKT